MLAGAAEVVRPPLVPLLRLCPAGTAHSCRPGIARHHRLDAAPETRAVRDRFGLGRFVIESSVTNKPAVAGLPTDRW